MKKILFVIPDLRGGGAERVLTGLLGSLDPSLFSVSLLAIFDCGENKKRLPASIAYRSIFKKQFRGNSHLFQLFSPEALYRRWIPEEYDIVVSFLEGTAARLVSGCVSPSTRKVCWIHTSLRSPQVFTAGFRNKEEAIRCYESFDRLVCVSESVRQDLPVAQEKAAVLYNPIDARAIRRLAAQEPPFPLPEGNIKLCCIGRLTAVKGFDRLIPILRRLKDNGFPVCCYLLGEGAEREHLLRAAKDAGIADRLFLTGFLENPYAVLSRCDWFVCCSHREGFSSAAAEALICGVPVVTVDLPGMREILGEDEPGGIICDNNDQALYACLCDALRRTSAPLREQAKKRGAFFDKEKAVQAIEKYLLAL